MSFTGVRLYHNAVAASNVVHKLTQNKAKTARTETPQAGTDNYLIRYTIGSVFEKMPVSSLFVSVPYGHLR